MNSHPPSNTAQEIVHLEKLRAQLSADIQVMQQKEARLKEYEQRLLQLMDSRRQPEPPPLAAPASGGPGSQAALDAEWKKYDRAHALLGAARRGLTDERLAFREREEKLMRREALVRAREQELALVQPLPAANSAPSFATSPFRAAWNLLKPAKAKPAA